VETQLPTSRRTSSLAELSGGFNLGGLTSIAGISLIWLFLHPLARDELNLVVVGAFLFLSVPMSLAFSSRILRSNRNVFASLVVLMSIAALGTLVAGGGLSPLRDVSLISVTVLLGVSLSLGASRRTVLWGITGGALLVAGVGWLLSFRRNGPWDGFDYDFVGVTDNAGPEHFSALVGLVSSLALLSRGKRQSALAVGCAMILGFTLLVAGASIGVITLLTTVLGAVFIWSVRRSSGILTKALWAGGGIVGALGLGLVANRSLSTNLAREIGELKSVDIRYTIWDSAVQGISSWGWLIGHGAFFWDQESPRRAVSSAFMTEAGYPAYSHAHNAYLDLFLAFGIVGAAVIIFLAAITVQNSRLKWATTQDWTDYALPLLVVFSLCIQSVSQSNLVSRPAGWLLCGVLIGLLTVVRDTEQASRFSKWAPWVSKPRSTD
jgi:hypothetical protein